MDETFTDKVIVPGFIAQHDHPLLTALTMMSEIIAIEDWVLPSGTVPAAKIKDIKIWGTVHEGRKLPLQHQDVSKVALGPVANEATYKAMDLETLAHEGEVNAHGDVCMLNKVFATAMRQGK